MKYLVITIARKPCSEGTVAANALRWGTGGINIEGSRVGISKSIPASIGSHSFATLNCGWGLKSGTWDHAVRDPNVGRFPANLILCHKPGCRQVGEKKVKSSHLNHDCMGKGALGGWGFAVARKQGHASPDGTETVAAWECEPGCPVADLDKQSGVVPTGTWNRQTDGAHPFGNAKDTPYENWKQVEEAPGGASRYFKQVQ